MHGQPFALRMAGFPMSWLTELADPATAEAAGMIMAKQREQDARIRQTSTPLVLTAVRESGDRTLLRAARTGRGTITPDRVESAAVRELFAEIAAGWEELRALRAQFDKCYDAGITQARLRVCERFVKDESLRDMLFSQNPGSYRAIGQWLDKISLDPADWRAKDRVKLDPLTLYLQRACAKNDSTGHAGPFTIGRFDTEAEGIQTTEVPLRHHAFMSRWAAETILRRLPANTAPRQAPGVHIQGSEVDFLPLDYSRRGHIDYLIGRQVRYTDLSETDIDVLALCNGENTLAEISAALDVDAGPSADRLAARGLIIREPEIPYGVEDPMPLLAELAEQVPSGLYKQLLDVFASTMTALAEEGSAQRREAVGRLHSVFAETVGEQSTRNAGGFYEDRALVYEETTGRFDGLVLGREVTERIRQALPLITSTYLFVPRIRLQLERALVADWFGSRFPAGTASVNDYTKAFAEDRQRLAPAFAEFEDQVAGWHRRLRDAAAEAVAQPDGGRTRFMSFLAEHGIDMPAVCDIDLMLAGTPGAEGLVSPSRLVVTEVHSDEELLSHGMFAPFVAERYPGFTDQVLEGYRSLLRGDEIIMNATVRHANKTFARRALDCPEIESGDRSPVAVSLRRHLADLVVQAGEQGPALIERTTGRPVRLIAIPFSWQRFRYNPMTVFGFPKRLTGSLFGAEPGEHLPEIGFGDVLLSRRAWSVDADEVRGKDTADGFLAVQRLRDRLGLPRHVFVRVAQEGKPIYVDLDSPLLVRQLSRFAAPAQAVGFSEMVPGPQELWARAGGQAFTSELRFAAFDPGQ
ncbi:hypothetical protein JOF56_006797 [Kibdelosporangium banguiense]|uniref:Lantibiotic dehydratase N-terminal domain-containing protein n=1 Tax=Kibdelosporangium banguiense TaxID=1365924 RepID=A0ABS4TPT5_9PSEU|nr:lantibiotic dehydratase [Kibdelosporangium banguiense]MBP2326412.1 hypothetical protein [Kibdelosporangium banguiense]